MEKFSTDGIWNIPRQSFDQMKKETRPALPQRAPPKRILIVDDDSDAITYFIELTKDEWNYEPEVVLTVRAAKAVISSGAELAVALLDERLINGTGVDLYRFIVSQRPALNVAFLTNYDSELLQRAAQDIGPARVFDKGKLRDAAYLEQLMLQCAIERRT